VIKHLYKSHASYISTVEVARLNYFIVKFFFLFCVQLDLRRKQFHVLVTAIHELQHILEGTAQCIKLIKYKAFRVILFTLRAK
jgi:hypothetical protein